MPATLKRKSVKGKQKLPQKRAPALVTCAKAAVNYVESRTMFFGMFDDLFDKRTKPLDDENFWRMIEILKLFLQREYKNEEEEVKTFFSVLHGGAWPFYISEHQRPSFIFDDAIRFAKRYTVIVDLYHRKLVEIVGQSHDLTPDDAVDLAEAMPLIGQSFSLSFFAGQIPTVEGIKQVIKNHWVTQNRMPAYILGEHNLRWYLKKYARLAYIREVAGRKLDMFGISLTE